jgi:hypothetical protein
MRLGFRTYALAFVSVTFAGGAIAACAVDVEALPDPTTDTDASTADAVVDRRVIDAPRDNTQPPFDAGSDVRDTGIPDVGSDVRDAAVEADAGLPPEGSPCSPPNATQSQPCGKCGTQSRLCLNTGGDAGATWQAWGACNGEVVNGCVPGTSDSVTCGFCGKMTRVCQNTCVWANGSCVGEAPVQDRCYQGEEQYVEGISCAANMGRTRTCTPPPADGGAGGCTWGNYSVNCVPTPTSLIIPTTVGNFVSHQFSLPNPSAPSGGQTTRLYASGWSTGNRACGPDGGMTTDAAVTSVTNNTYVIITNPTNQTAKVSVWVGQAADASAYDSVMAAYPGTTPPVTEAERINCLGYANDDCTVPDASPTPYPLACLSAQAGIFYVATDTASGVTIPPNSSVNVYVASYYSGTFYTYPFRLFAKTETLQ